MLRETLEHVTDLRWLCGSVLGLTSFYIGFSIIYNIFFHPLRHYPGSWYRAASRLPYTTSIFRGDATHRVAALHERYGNIVRVAPDTLSYITTEAWSDIYGNKHHNGRGGLQKDPKAYLRYSHDAEISTALDSDHRRLRRIQSHAFSTKALELQKPVLEQYISKFSSCLRKTADSNQGVADMTKLLNCLTMDIIGDLAFGEDFGSLDAGDLQPRLQTLFTAMKQFTFVKEILRLPSFLRMTITTVLSVVMKRRGPAINDVGAEVMVKRRNKSEVERPDMVSYMLKQAGGKDGGMTHKEVDKAALTFVIAGSETTATLLSGAVYLLMSNRLALDKLTAAIRADFETREAFTYAKLEQHEYLNAVLQESLRLYPPAPDMLFRSTMEETAMVAGKIVPPQTSVTINLWAANRSTSNFHRPAEFLPERWLKHPPAEFQEDCRSVLNPFSIGLRNCIGMNLAWIEMRMSLASMLFDFDLLEVQSDSRDWIDRQKIFFLWEKLPLNIRIRPRS